MIDHRPGTCPEHHPHQIWGQRHTISSETARSSTCRLHTPTAATLHLLHRLYREVVKPVTSTMAWPLHLQHLHNKARTHLAAAKRGAEDKSSARRTAASLRRPRHEHLTSPDRRIREEQTPAARQLRQRPRREGDRAPATLFQCGAPIPFTRAPAGHTTLLSTTADQRSGVPLPSRRRNGRRRGEEPAVPTAVDEGKVVASGFASYATVERGGGVRACSWVSCFYYYYYY